jgi:hypothetical protein
MSQVFPFRASMIKWALLFKDSMSGTEERVKLLDSHTNCKCTHRSKTKRCPPRGIAWTFTPKQISVPHKRGRFTQPMLFPRGLDNS